MSKYFLDIIRISVEVIKEQKRYKTEMRKDKGDIIQVEYPRLRHMG